MTKRILYGLAIAVLLIGTFYVFALLDAPNCSGEDHCEGPTRGEAFAGVVTVSLILAYVGRTMGNDR